MPVSKWHTLSLGMTQKPTTEPVLVYNEQTKRWILQKTLVTFPVSLHPDGVMIAKHFDTDLASVPTVLRNIVATNELSVKGAVTHDWLYRNGGHVSVIGPDGIHSVMLTRAQADQCFLDLMESDGIGWFKRQAAYHAVRLFAGSAWQADVNIPLPPAASS
jgi:hypothetical protein